MNKQQISEIMKRIELCCAFTVDDEYYALDYTSVHTNTFGYTCPNSGKKYTVEVTEDCQIKDGKLVIENSEYEFKQLQSVSMDYTQV